MPPLTPPSTDPSEAMLRGLAARCPPPPPPHRRIHGITYQPRAATTATPTRPPTATPTIEAAPSPPPPSSLPPPPSRGSFLDNAEVQVQPAKQRPAQSSPGVPRGQNGRRWHSGTTGHVGGPAAGAGHRDTGGLTVCASGASPIGVAPPSPHTDDSAAAAAAAAALGSSHTYTAAVVQGVGAHAPPTPRRSDVTQSPLPSPGRGASPRGHPYVYVTGTVRLPPSAQT